MSKQSNNIKVSVADIVQLFQTAPEQAYEQLITSSYYFHKQPKNFWNAYMQLDHDKLSKQFPDSVDTFNQVVWLKLFYDLNEFYKTERANNIEALTALNPDETSLTKSLFLCLELGETSVQPTNFPNYSEESLEAIKILLREVLPLLKSENKSSYSLELAQLSNNLIKVQVDMALLEEFLDACVWADFEMIKKEDSKGFVLSLPDGKPKSENLFVLNYLKTFVKRDFKRKESHPKISEEEHFKKNDPKWKTQEGLATVIHSSGMIVTSQTPGTTSLQAEDESILTDMTSEDPKKRESATFKMLMNQQEQNFHYQYRQALSQIYQPNDEIDIHALHVEIDANTFVSLYELLCAMSCLIARADAFRYIGEFPNSGSIKSIKRSVLDLISQQKPELSANEKESMANSEIVHHFKMFDEHYEQKIFFFFTEENILGWFAKVEELKSKSQKELKAIINLFSSFNSPLPFNPIYKIENTYHFSYTTCTCGKFNLNQLLYDYYISDKLFKSNPKYQSLNERRLIGENQRNREIRFTKSLNELFQTVTPFVEARLEFGDPKLNYDFKDLKGEFDLLAYFEKENIIFPIQVKLSNVSPRSEKRKKEWIIKRIEEEGIKQVVKDIKLLESKSGLKFVADKLKTEREIKAPLIYPLIVSDNFFADHISFPFNENDDCVICVSYFELKHLLLNQKVHDKQADFLPLENSNVATHLIEAIETNSFWNFLNEFADDFKFSKTLSAITDDWKIEMKV
jgi:hypothetical protein